MTNMISDVMLLVQGYISIELPLITRAPKYHYPLSLSLCFTTLFASLTLCWHHVYTKY